MEGSQNRAFETHAYVLATIPPKVYLRDGRPRGETVVQAIGESFFTLLELAPHRGETLNSQERVNISRNSRGKIDHVRRRVFFDDLAPESAAELQLVVEMIVTKDEHKYVQFFNEANPITTRMHSLQLLPGIGFRHHLSKATPNHPGIVPLNRSLLYKYHSRPPCVQWSRKCAWR